MTQHDPAGAPGPLTWEPPGPGEWMLDTTHHGRRPVTAHLRPLNDEAFGHLAVMFARYGLPLESMAVADVNGCTYIRPRAVGEGDRPKPPPPQPIMRILARLHPELRRRNRTARQAWEERRWRTEVDRWFDHDRAAVVAANRRFGAVALERLDDGALVAHLDELGAHCLAQAIAGFETHGGDIVPVGDYLAHCSAWGIPVDRAAELLRGASPASMATAASLDSVARALEDRSDRPASLDEVRALGPDCRSEVDEWVATFAWRLVSSDDLDGTTLAEQPHLLLPALLAAAGTRPPASPDPGAVRSLVPPDQRGLFDELLAEARYGMPLRDDNVGVRWNWPLGLTRRALLEVGRRLVAAGRMHRPEHAVELAPPEVAPLLLDGVGPTADEIAGRLQWRLAIEAAEPPAVLGDPEPPPPFDALPAPMARAARAVMALIEAMESSSEAAAVDQAGSAVVGRGTGIGQAMVEGPARVVHDAADALSRLQPGDILVAPFTGPAYNAVLPLVAGLVVEEGGPLCHAAIVAREFGKPAVVGAAGITGGLVDGELIRLDPATGAVTRVGAG